MGETNEALKSALISSNLSAFPLSEFENQDMSETFKTVTSPSGNTLLHIAVAESSHDHANMTTALARKYPFMITMQNSKRETPLHVAAKAGMLETVKILIDCAKKSGMTSSSKIDVKSLMEMQNCRENTALHEAFIALQHAKKEKNKHKEESVTSLTKFLVSEDPNASYLKNVEGKSPLCQAVESEKEDILECILNALPGNDDCATKLEGISPVKVAIEHKKLGMLEMMHKKQPALLLIQDDEHRNTPMHWAASVDHLEGVRFLYKINPDSVLQQNKEGFYPFHLASENGRVRVMDEFFEKENMPHPTELFNNKGQNILHVAAKRGKFDSVRHILKTRNMDKLINERDDDGNTPLHLAASYGRHLAVASLMLDGRAKSDIINFHGQTAYHIAEQLSAKINPEFSGNVVDEENQKQQKSKSKPDEYNKPEVQIRVDNYDCQAQVQIRVDNYETTDKNMMDSESKPIVYNTAKVQIRVDTHETTDKKMKDSEKKTSVYDTMMTVSLLFIVYNYHQLFRPGGTFLRNLLRLIENLYKTSKQSPVNKTDVSNRISNLMVVAALIAGASFAASVQMGSSSNSDSEKATTNTTASIGIHGAGAVPFALANSTGHGGGDDSQNKKHEAPPSLKAFTVFNTIAMYTSITAAIVLCWAQLLDTNLASVDVWAASLLIVIALYASCIAFLTSIYMLNDTGEVFLVAITVIQGVLLLILLFRSFQLVVPFRLKKLFILLHYFVYLWVFYFLNWIWSSLKKTRCCARCLHGKPPKE